MIGEIVAELGVSRSSVSVWVRDVHFDEATRAARACASRRFGARKRGPDRLQRQKQAEIDRLPDASSVTHREIMGSCMRCYAARSPIRGSSTGRAVGC